MESGRKREEGQREDRKGLLTTLPLDNLHVGTRPPRDNQVCEVSAVSVALTGGRVSASLCRDVTWEEGDTLNPHFCINDGASIVRLVCLSGDGRHGVGLAGFCSVS